MASCRVLVTDDSALFRKILTKVISEEPTFEVVGTARDGVDCLEKIRSCSPDIVTMDVEMPRMNGLDTVTEIQKEWPRLPIIMFSSVTKAGGKAALEALSRGASDYVAKPGSMANSGDGMRAIRDELIPKIRALVPTVRARSVAPERANGKRPDWHPPSVAHPRPVQARVDCLVIGSSTGGPNALSEVMPGLGSKLGVPVLLTQHMPPVFTGLLAERMNECCGLSVVEAQDGDLISADHVYVAPGDYHMTVSSERARRVIRLSKGDKENYCRPAVDPMFRSAAAVYGSGVLAVVLTGMGRDGSKGALALREVGAQVIAQDEATSVVWGMPGAVVGEGAADEVLPLEDIAGRVVTRIMAGSAKAKVNR